jgi:hypothetical protein
MARMTATDFVGFTRKRMGNPSTDDWTDAELLRFVNMAQERVALGSPVATLETFENLSVTKAAGEIYEFAASDIMYITSAKNMTNGQRLRPTDRDAYTHDSQGASLPSGNVERWLEGGLGANGRKQVTLQYKPTQSITVRFWYLAYPTEMVLSPTATSSELPREYDEAIMDIAAEIAKKNDQQMREASTERNLAKETEARASGIAPMTPERRYGIKSEIADSTQTRTKK